MHFLLRESCSGLQVFACRAWKIAASLSRTMKQLRILLFSALALGLSACSHSAECQTIDWSCSPYMSGLLFERSPKYIFVSAAGTNANYGGVTGTDASCSSSKPASLPGSESDYRALVMAAARNLSTGWVLAPGTEYRRQDGLLVFRTNAARLPVFPFENQVTGTSASIWTGITVVSASSWITGTTCGDWTQNFSLGDIGTSDQTTNTFIMNGQTSCATALALYCVQQ